MRKDLLEWLKDWDERRGSKTEGKGKGADRPGESRKPGEPSVSAATQTKTSQPTKSTAAASKATTTDQGRTSTGAHSQKKTTKPVTGAPKSGRGKKEGEEGSKK